MQEDQLVDYKISLARNLYVHYSVWSIINIRIIAHFCQACSLVGFFVTIGLYV